jgi:hypothetical protein
MALNEKSKAVFDYVKDNDDKEFTAVDIANALGMNPKSVNGIITMSFQRHRNAEKEIVPLMVRVPAEVELEDGTKKTIKFIHLTDEGKAFDPEA